MKVDKIISSIEEALQKECFLPALALALVLPDICSKFDYPQIHCKKETYEGHTGQGAAYSKWYDVNIGDYNTNPVTNIKIFDGWNCWKLRCGFLHDGSIDLEKEMNVRFKMTSSRYIEGALGISGISYSLLDSGKAVPNIIDFDISQFCGQIISVVKNSYLNNKEFIGLTERRMLNYIEFM